MMNARQMNERFEENLKKREETLVKRANEFFEAQEEKIIEAVDNFKGRVVIKEIPADITSKVAELFLANDYRVIHLNNTAIEVIWRG